MSKPWYTSKTVIFNAVMAALVAFISALPDDVAWKVGALEALAALAALSNVFLRSITTKPIHLVK